MENTQEMLKDVLLLGHHLRRQPMASKPSWRPNPCEVQFHLGLRERSILKQTPRTHPDFVFDDPHMDGKIIS
jgi:hypothetical protein